MYVKLTWNQSTTFYGALVQQFSLLAGNVAGHTKKSVTNATVVLLANLGGFSKSTKRRSSLWTQADSDSQGGPWSYHGDEAARGYPTGQISALCLMCASEAAFALLWYEVHLRTRGCLLTTPGQGLLLLPEQEEGGSA